MGYQEILCPVDFSDCSRAALQRALKLVAGRDTRVTLVYVLSTAAFVPMEGMLDTRYLQILIDSAESSLAAWTQDAKRGCDARVESVFLQGAPWERIVHLAKERNAEVIVMGTHGRTDIKHALIGSVTERVVRHAPCEVLVVPPARS
jgi:nucleotide-binding universal stress UspA family protein